MTNAPNVLRWVARILIVLWGGFWVWFNLASGLSDVGEAGAGALLVHSGVALVIALVVLVSWRWELPASLLLLAVAVAFQLFFHPKGLTALILTAPPAVIGLLLLAAWWLRRRSAAVG